MGSAGTGTGSRTGSGGPGIFDPPVDDDGGGVTGRATGGFFFEHALTIISATLATAKTVRLWVICLPCPLSALLIARGAPPPLALARRLRASLGPQALSLLPFPFYLLPFPFYLFPFVI